MVEWLVPPIPPKEFLQPTHPKDLIRAKRYTTFVTSNIIDNQEGISMYNMGITYMRELGAMEAIRNLSPVIVLLYGLHTAIAFDMQELFYIHGKQHCFVLFSHKIN